MDAESRMRAIAQRCGWTDEVLQEVMTVLAAECNAAFDHGQWVERGRAEADAVRYRWLKARKGLDLRSERENQKWTRPDGSVFFATHSLAADGIGYAAAESLDAMIDSAMAGAQP